METLGPPVNALVDVAGASWDGWVRTRVEDTDHHGGSFVLARPSVGRGHLAAARVGDRLRVKWLLARGVAHVDARVAGTEDGPIPIWRLTAVSTARVEQRRNFVRAPLFLRTLVRVGEHEHTTIAVDLSEAGIRCSGSHADALAPGTPIEIVLDIDGDPVCVHALVVRAGASAGPSPWWAATFVDVPLRTTDRLRRFVFATLTRHRARGQR